jgi:hypothetical protein
MADYYLNQNKQSNDDYEVHLSTCSFLPAQSNREYLGAFDYCWQAVSEAKRRHPTWHRINGCYYCVPSCHTT